VETDNTFRGTFPCAVDLKRRLTVPSRFAKALTPRAQRTFVAVHGLERCLSLYPLDFWQAFERNLQTAEFADPATRQGIRRLLAFAEDLQLDKQNRITISQGLLDFARIKRDVHLVGLTDHLELWEPLHWNDVMNAPGIPSFEEVFTKLGPTLQKTALEVGERRQRDASGEGTQ
jgi:MraZ protein